MEKNEAYAEYRMSAQALGDVHLREMRQGIKVNEWKLVAPGAEFCSGVDVQILDTVEPWLAFKGIFLADGGY